MNGELNKFKTINILWKKGCNWKEPSFKRKVHSFFRLYFLQFQLKKPTNLISLHSQTLVLKATKERYPLKENEAPLNPLPPSLSTSNYRHLLKAPHKPVTNTSRQEPQRLHQWRLEAKQLIHTTPTTPNYKPLDCYSKCRVIIMQLKPGESGVDPQGTIRHFLETYPKEKLPLT